MTDERASDVSRLLNLVTQGNDGALGNLLDAVYGELRQQADRFLAREAPGHTLQPTDLVHEAFLRLVGSAERGQLETRARFFGAAAEAMRRILVEHARRHLAIKHGGGRRPVTFHDVGVECETPTLDVLALDEAMTALEQEHPDHAQLTKLRYFASLTLTQIAELLGISHATAKRRWLYARAWLFQRMKATVS